MKQTPHYNGHYFEVPMVSAVEWFHVDTYPESLSKVLLRGPKHQTNVSVQ